MSGSSQFYADNEKDGSELKDIDLSIASELRPKIIPEGEWENQQVLFFCHDCEKTVGVEKSKKNVKFICKECGNQNISFGTEKSIRNFFRLNDDGERKK